MLHLPRGFLAAMCGLTAAAAVALAAGLAPVQAAEGLRIGGTGSALASMQRLADAFTSRHPEIDVLILPSLGSSGGIKALIAGKIEFGVSARPLAAHETAAGLVEHAYARTPLVFATRPDTAADDITLAQVAGVYRGDTATWPDGSRLRPVVRPAGDTDTAFLRTLSPEMNTAVDIAIGRDDLFVAINDQDNAKALADIRGSFGLISVGQVLSEGRAVKLLTLDGKAGTIAALRDGTYPHARQLYVMVGSEPSPPVAAFLAFLFSAEGARLLTEAGYLPTASVD